MIVRRLFRVALLAAPLVSAAHVVRGAEPVPSFTNHGVAAAVSESRGVLTARAAGGSDLVVVLPMDRYRGELRASLLVVDPATGKSEQYWYPRKEAGTDAPFAVLLAST